MTSHLTVFVMSIRSIDERLIIALMLEMMSAWSRVQQVGEIVTLSPGSDLRRYL